MTDHHRPKHPIDGYDEMPNLDRRASDAHYKSRQSSPWGWIFLAAFLVAAALIAALIAGKAFASIQHTLVGLAA